MKHMFVGLSEINCICVFLFVYYDVRHLETSFLTSMYPALFKNILPYWIRVYRAKLAVGGGNSSVAESRHISITVAYSHDCGLDQKPRLFTEKKHDKNSNLTSEKVG